MSAATRCVLLTGAGGFVGRRLAPHLAKWAGAGARLVALVRGSTAPEGFEARVVNLADEAAFDAVMGEVRPTIVIHLAAQSSVGAAAGASASTWRTNAFGSLALAASCASHAPEATVLYASSAEVYGTSFNIGPVGEDAELRPQNTYARSKAAAELVFNDVLDQRNRLVIVRPFNHSGAGQDERFVLPSFAAQVADIEAGRRPPVMNVGNLDAERDFLHVEEVCSAYIALLNEVDRLPKRSVFNVCSGRTQSIRSLLELMRERSRVPFAISIDPARMRTSDIPRAVGLGGRLATATGFEPKADIIKLVEELLDHARRPH